MACATKTRLPQTTGEEFPGPGSATRQRTFSFVLHFSGRFFSLETPVPSGPRQPGQLAAEAEAAALEIMRMAAKQWFSFELFITLSCAKETGSPQEFSSHFHA